MAELSEGPEMDPERTPEGTSLQMSVDPDLWQKVEEERGQRSWDRYNRIKSAREKEGPREQREPPPRERRPPRHSEPRELLRQPREAELRKSRSQECQEGLDREDLWQKAEAELQSRRAQAASRGLRVFDMARGHGREVRGQERSDVYPSRTCQSSWQGTLQPDGRNYKVLLSRRQLDDVALQHWCRWARPRLKQLPPSAVVTVMELGFNKITAQGLQTLLHMLMDLQVPVEALSIHHNLLNDEAADALAQYLQLSSYTLFELSLTNNQIGEPGARSLLEAAVRATQSPSELEQIGANAVRYPALRHSQKVPLWLRLGYNRIGDGRPGFVRNFLRRTEAELQKIRQNLGNASESQEEDPWANFVGLKAGGMHVPDSSTHLFCEALSGLGCEQRRCTQLYPEVNGFPAGPVVHLYQFDQQLDRDVSQMWQGRPTAPRRRSDEGKGERGEKGGKSKGKSKRPLSATLQMRFGGPKSAFPGRLDSSRASLEILEEPEENRFKELRGLFDPAARVQEGTNDKPMSPNSSRSRGTLGFVVRDVLEPEGLGAEVSLWPLRSGDAVRVLYQGSEDLGDCGYLFASFNGREGWVPATALSGNWKARQTSEKGLPPFWEEHWSDEYNVPYFWNSRTKESVWVRPES